MGEYLPPSSGEKPRTAVVARLVHEVLSPVLLATLAGRSKRNVNSGESLTPSLPRKAGTKAVAGLKLVGTSRAVGILTILLTAQI